MPRPRKATVDYFPHYVNHKKTIMILEGKYKNDGYAFWFKLLEILGETENHYFDCNDSYNWMFLLTKTLVDDEMATEILNLLANLNAIDPELWLSKVIRSQNFIDNLHTVYNRREINVYSKADIMGLMYTETPLNGVSVGINPQSKGKERKGKERKVNKGNPEASKMNYNKIANEIIEYFNTITKRECLISENNRGYIIPRLKEGHTIEQAKKAIDNICASQWHQENPKAINIETIFRPSKFERNVFMGKQKPKITNSTISTDFDEMPEEATNGTFQEF